MIKLEDKDYVLTESPVWVEVEQFSIHIRAAVDGLLVALYDRNTKQSRSLRGIRLRCALTGLERPLSLRGIPKIRSSTC